VVDEDGDPVNAPAPTPPGGDSAAGDGTIPEAIANRMNGNSTTNGNRTSSGNGTPNN
jgi:hypothetical protein